MKFSFNTGIYYQLPPYTVLGYRDENNVLINKDNNVTYIQSRQIVAGLEYVTNSNTKITLEGFYKHYENYPFLVRDSISLANLGADFGVIGDEEVISSSKGRAFGMEFFTQRKLTDGIYGLISYTLSWSQFEDKNLESVWRPENYTGKFYGLTSLRSALIRSINIVSIKLLRGVGIDKSLETIEKFGFEKNRIPKDLSLALGSGNFSPAEMVRAFGVIASEGYIKDLYYVDRVEDRFGNIIYSSDANSKLDNKNLSAFPWLNTLEMNIKSPYYLLKPIESSDKVIDERVAYLIKDTLKDFMKNGTAGRKSAFLNRDDIGGKTGTTNDAVSTWFSGFHDDLVTTVWVGTDDFTSLGNNEYGSTISMPIWLDYMSVALKDLEEKPVRIPPGMTYIKVDKETGEINNSQDSKNSYFELFLNENIAKN